MTANYIQDSLTKAKTSSFYHESDANALYLWVINTQGCYKNIMRARSQYLAGAMTIKQFVTVCLNECLDQRKPLQQAEGNLRVNLLNSKVAALNVADYYLNVYQD